MFSIYGDLYSPFFELTRKAFMPLVRPHQHTAECWSQNPLGQGVVKHWNRVFRKQTWLPTVLG